MEEVLSQFESTGISNNDKTNFDGLYKYWGRYGSQDQRRSELLDVQKSNRNTKLDKFRGILDLVNTVEGHAVFKSNTRAYYRPSMYVAGFNKATYSQVLMMSEWMVEKPSDFDSGWLVVPCPKGVRTLVVATNGNTKVFNKFGVYMFDCRSALPGGNPCDRKFKSSCCVLDCFYHKTANIMYVLDILAWNSQPMTDGECEFRDFWLNMHLADLPELKSINKKNEMIFYILPKKSCAPESFNKFMMTFPHFSTDISGLDGLLFYHKKAHYVSGQTPLAVWLYPFMVPEVLGEDITVHQTYMLEKPINYINQVEFIKDFEMKNDKKKGKGQRKKGSRRNSAMDTTEATDTENKTEKTKKKPEESSNDDKHKTETMDVSQPKTVTMKIKKTPGAESETMEVKETGVIQADALVKEIPETSQSKTGIMEAESAPDSLDKTNDTMEAEAITEDKPKE